MSDISTIAVSVAKLKDQGNALFVKKQYREAYQKYTEAIKQDDKNAIICANRAACCLNLKKYMDAAKDAQLAVEIDPTYSKAWARRATALNMIAQHEESLRCWKEALVTLQKEKLTAAKLKQKEEYKAEFEAMRLKIEHMKAAPTEVGIQLKTENMPWVKAEAIIDSIRSRGFDAVTSSAYAILGANEEFKQGMSKMKLQKETNVPGVGVQISGVSGALENLSNAVMRDSRIFHIAEQNWIKMFNNQNGGAAYAIEQAQKRHREEGFDGVRRALSVTIRSWLLLGFLEGGLRQIHATQIEYMARAVEVLDWGRKKWRNVPTDDKGVIFIYSFYMGVRAMLMQAYMEAYADNPGPSSKFPPKLLRDEAQNFLREFEDIAPPPGVVDPGFCSSFYVYPKGQAHALIAYANAQMARIAASKKEEEEIVIDYFNKAAQGYLEAASFYPQDDEQHVWYLNCALDHLYVVGTTIADLLPVMERIRLAIPEMKKIWEFSQMSQNRDKALQKTLWVEEDIREGLLNGKFTMDVKIMPEQLK
ncbi:hypothetical protein C8Q75DRAFT_804170 [Abortiporus biennis]|nr:hypothetical protein C8Q75DRAFT_804170 [Abortiporus biennis]